MENSPESINWSRFSHRLWRAWGVDVRVNISLYLIFLGIIWIPFTAWGHLPRTLLFREATDLGLLFVALNAAILVHELGHALTAKLLGNKVRLVLIHALGGCTILEEDEARESWHAVAIFASGPIASALYGLACRMGGFEHIAEFSFALVSLNLLPIFPLDGGQMLWHMVGSQESLSGYQITISRWAGRLTFGVLAYEYSYWTETVLLLLFWLLFEYIMYALTKD